MATSRDFAFSLGRLLAEHKGGGVVILDLSGLSDWTDWFVIATAGNVTQLRGLARHVEEYAASQGVEARGHPSIPDDEEWVLLDFGETVIHLMSENARRFYELERLWFQAPLQEIAAPA